MREKDQDDGLLGSAVSGNATTELHDGGPAFPQIETDPEYAHHSSFQYGNTYSYGGMSLRDYFAGQALIARIVGQGLLVAAAISANWPYELNDPFGAAARDAFRYADAMITAREAK